MSVSEDGGFKPQGGKGSVFFANRDCEHFPCHETSCTEDFNCLFCFCPLYFMAGDCGGANTRTSKGIKDCGGCLFPHRRENYGEIISRISKMHSYTQNGEIE